MDDARALAAVTGYAVYLAMVSALYAGWSVWREEDSPYPAAGLACSACALYLQAPLAGAGLLVVGGTALLMLRRVAWRKSMRLRG